MTLYGIPTCQSVKKAKKFLQDRGIEHSFVDFKKTPVGCETIDAWLAHVPVKQLFNARGMKYRTLGLKQLQLNDAGKREWLCKENLLIKRPVIEHEGKVLVGFDPQLYSEIFDG